MRSSVLVSFFSLCCMVGRSVALPPVARPWALSYTKDEDGTLHAVSTEEAEKKAKAKAQHEHELSLKYFHEAEPNGQKGNVWQFNHYDARYFNGLQNYDSHKLIQQHMARAYLATFNELGLETWLAHGTLLGWWWNEQGLPWDLDVDVQVSEETMAILADQLNSTIFTYSSILSPSSSQIFSREYLLDVNPHSRERDRGDGFNIIEARWIDVKSGIYIDITAVREMEPEDKPGILVDKNFHEFRFNDLFPLVDTVYEGVACKVPSQPAWILAEEYKEAALINPDYEGHHFDFDLRMWIKNKQLISQG